MSTNSYFYPSQSINESAWDVHSFLPFEIILFGRIMKIEKTNIFNKLQMMSFLCKLSIHFERVYSIDKKIFLCECVCVFSLWSMDIVLFFAQLPNTDVSIPQSNEFLCDSSADSTWCNSACVQDHTCPTINLIHILSDVTITLKSTSCVLWYEICSMNKICIFWPLSSQIDQIDFWMSILSTWRYTWARMLRICGMSMFDL